MKDKINFFLDVIKRYDHYIATTNFKIGLLMSFLVAVILGLTLRLILINNSQETVFCINILLFYSVVATILSALVTIFMLLSVVFPVTNNSSEYSSMIFFGDVAKTDNGAKGFYNKIIKASDEEILEDVACQTFVVAEITTKKFKQLQMAVNMTKYAVLPLLAISLIIILTIK